MAVKHEWTETSRPFNWTTKSVAKVVAKCPRADSTRFGLAA